MTPRDYPAWTFRPTPEIVEAVAQIEAEDKADGRKFDRSKLIQHALASVLGIPDAVIDNHRVGIPRTLSYNNTTPLVSPLRKTLGRRRNKPSSEK